MERYRRVAAIERQGPELKALSDASLGERAAALKQQALAGRSLDELLNDRSETTE